MNIRDWRQKDNKNVTELLLTESFITAVVLYQNDMQRANVSRTLRDRLNGYVSDHSLWSIKLTNGNVVKLVPLQRSQIELKGISISLLLFPSSIEYTVRQRLTRELYPQFIRDGGIIGTINI